MVYRRIIGILLRVKLWTYYRNNWGFTELDSMIAVLRVKHLKAGWPFQPENKVNDFRATYIPHGIVDSLAFISLKYIDVSPVMVHKKLAAYYESTGDLKHASKEYLSLAYYSPTEVSSYYYAADLAYKAEDYINAIRYLNESPNSDTSLYAQFTLASIYFSQKDNKDALLSINKLENLQLNDNFYLQVQKLKYKILMASGLDSEAEKTLAYIKGVDPSFNRSNAGKSFVILIPSKIKPFLEKSESLRKNGQISEALSVLKEANAIQEIPYTDLLIGKILFSQKNVEALYYLEKAKKEMKNDPSLDYCLSVLYLIKRNIPNAKASIDDFARLRGSNNPQTIQLRNLLEKTITAENKSR